MNLFSAAVLVVLSLLLIQASAKDNGKIDDKTCTKYDTVKKDTTCRKYIRKNRLNRKQFYEINQNVVEKNCPVLAAGTVVCQNNGKVDCLKFYKVNTKKVKNCADLAAAIGQSVEKLTAVNQLLDCTQDFQKNFMICEDVATVDCGKQYTIAAGDTLQRVLKKFRINKKYFNRANPNFIDDGALDVDDEVCVELKEKNNFHLLTSELEELASLNAAVEVAYSDYIADPCEETTKNLKKAIRVASKDKKFANGLKKVEGSDNVKKLKAQDGLDSNKRCEFLTKTRPNSEATACFCDPDKSYTDCAIVYVDEMNYIVNSRQVKKEEAVFNNEEDFSTTSTNVYIPETSNSTHVKKRDLASLMKTVGCGVSFSSNVQETCVSGECCIGVGLQLCLGAQFCYEKNPTNLAGYKVSISMSLCFKILGELLELMGLSSIWDACLASASLSYYPFRGQFAGDATVSFIFLRFSIGFEYQAYEPHSSLCQTESCLTYCAISPGNVYFTGFKISVSCIFWWEDVYSTGDATPDCRFIKDLTDPKNLKTQGKTEYGDWSEWDNCPSNHAFRAFNLKVESCCHSDDTALNIVEFKCSDGSLRDTAFSDMRSWGGWKGYKECKADAFISGFQIRTEGAQGPTSDDTGANNFNIECSDGTRITGDGLTWGEWEPWQICPEGFFLMGVRGQTEDRGSSDKVSLNNVILKCGTITRPSTTRIWDYRVEKRILENPMMYVGCYTDDSGVHSVRQLFSDNNREKCISFCKDYNFFYAGLKDKECVCTNSLGSSRKMEESYCGWVCPFPYDNTKCGTSGYRSLYKTNLGYIGCFGDAGARDLPALISLGSSNSPQNCVSECRDRRFLYAGMQFGDCFCGNVFGKYGQLTQDKCNSKCSGASSEFCGGAWANSVYRTDAFIGCLKDASDRLLNGLLTRFDGSNNPLKCLNHCTEKGFLYSGTEVDNECHCGNSVGKYGSLTNDKCSSKCSGLTNEFCGGPWALSTFRTNAYIGCYSDSGTRDIGMEWASFSDNSALKCTSHCASKGYLYAGMQVGHECRCGNSFGRYGKLPRERCVSRCTGNSNEACGAGWANSVYRTRAYVGCVRDGGSRTLEGSYDHFSDNSPIRCINHCKSKGFAYAGMEVGSECHCGNSITRNGGLINESDCTSRCPGLNTEFCGGPWALTVWKTSF